MVLSYGQRIAAAVVLGLAAAYFAPPVFFDVLLFDMLFLDDFYGAWIFYGAWLLCGVAGPAVIFVWAAWTAGGRRVIDKWLALLMVLTAVGGMAWVPVWIMSTGGGE